MQQGLTEQGDSNSVTPWKERNFVLGLEDGEGPGLRCCAEFVFLQRSSFSEAALALALEVQGESNDLCLGLHGLDLPGSECAFGPVSSQNGPP